MSKVNLTTIQNRITTVWLAFAALLFIRNIFLSSDGGAEVVWSWYSTSILPATGLIIGLWLSIAWSNGGHRLFINKTSGVLAQGFVIFYIGAITLTILVDTVFGNVSPIENLERSQNWLSYIQAPMLALLGKVFADGREQMG